MIAPPFARPQASLSGYSSDDFATSPLVVFYEVTQACDLVCRHCRACAQPHRDPQELRPTDSLRLIDQLAEFPKPPLLVLTGGDPLQRPDLFALIRYAVRRRLEVAVTPSATPRVTEEAVAKLQEAGIARLAVSLDGPDAASHDGMRGVAGSFAHTLQILSWARRYQIPLQINTTITPHNFRRIEEFADLLAPYQIALWSVFFLVPVGRAEESPRLDPEQYEEVFAHLWKQLQRGRFPIKTTEAPHFRRFALQQQGDLDWQSFQRRPVGQSAHRKPLGINDGKGVLFVGHTGEIYPSGFLPLECGRFPRDHVVDVYQKSPLFCRLRDASQLLGKCGVCEFKQICGGSRARSFAALGDPLAAEPDCDYLPARWTGG